MFARLCRLVLVLVVVAFVSFLSQFLLGRTNPRALEVNTKQPILVNMPIDDLNDVLHA